MAATKLVGLDISDNIAIAVETDDGKAKIFDHPLVFLTLADDQASSLLLKKYSSSYIRHDGQIHMIGNDAINLSIIFGRDLVRPIKNGRLSKPELMVAAISKLLEKAGVKPEDAHVVFTVPAQSSDNSFESSYYRVFIEDVLTRVKVGTVSAVSHSQAVAFNELIEYDLTGVVVDIGYDLINVSLNYLAIPALEFSLNYGSNWISERVANALNVQVQHAAKMPQDDLAVAHFTSVFKEQLMADIVRVIESAVGVPSYNEAVNLIVSGSGVKGLPGEELKSALVGTFKSLGVSIAQGIISKNTTHSAVIGCLVVGTDDTESSSAPPLPKQPTVTSQPVVGESDDEQ